MTNKSRQRWGGKKRTSRQATPLLGNCRCSLSPWLYNQHDQTWAFRPCCFGADSCALARVKRLQSCCCTTCGAHAKTCTPYLSVLFVNAELCMKTQVTFASLNVCSALTCVEPDLRLTLTHFVYLHGLFAREVLLEHPKYPEFAKLGLKWGAVPSITSECACACMRTLKASTTCGIFRTVEILWHGRE